MVLPLDKSGDVRAGRETGWVGVGSDMSNTSMGHDERGESHGSWRDSPAVAGMSEPFPSLASKNSEAWSVEEARGLVR